VLFASRADQLPDSYRRYLVNSLRESFELPGVPVRLSVKSGKNPFAEGESQAPPRVRRLGGPPTGAKARGHAVSTSGKTAKPVKGAKPGKPVRLTKAAAAAARPPGRPKPAHPRRGPPGQKPKR
jgi:GTP-binding protein